MQGVIIHTPIWIELNVHLACYEFILDSDIPKYS